MLKTVQLTGKGRIETWVVLLLANVPDDIVDDIILHLHKKALRFMKCFYICTGLKVNLVQRAGLGNP